MKMTTTVVVRRNKGEEETTGEGSWDCGGGGEKTGNPHQRDLQKKENGWKS